MLICRADTSDFSEDSSEEDDDFELGFKGDYSQTKSRVNQPSSTESVTNDIILNGRSGRTSLHFMELTEEKIQQELDKLAVHLADTRGTFV